MRCGLFFYVLCAMVGEFGTRLLCYSFPVLLLRFYSVRCTAMSMQSHRRDVIVRFQGITNFFRVSFHMHSILSTLSFFFPSTLALARFWRRGVLFKETGCYLPDELRRVSAVCVCVCVCVCVSAVFAVLCWT